MRRLDQRSQSSPCRFRIVTSPYVTLTAVVLFSAALVIPIHSEKVKEISVNRDASLLPEVIPMVAEFQVIYSPAHLPCDVLVML